MRYSFSTVSHKFSCVLKKAKVSILIIAFFVICLILPSSNSRSYTDKRLLGEYDFAGTFTDYYPSFCSNLAEYDEYCMTNKLPPDYISYHQICSLGQFQYYISCRETIEPKSYFDRYLIIDQAGECMVFEITLPNIASLNTFLMGNVFPIYRFNSESDFAKKGAPSPDNMLVFPDGYKDKGTLLICYNGLWYSYSFGDLHSVFWQYKGKIFSVRSSDGSGDMTNTDTNADTFAAKLLNIETAEKAVEELMRACFPDREFTGLERIKKPEMLTALYKKVKERRQN